MSRATLQWPEDHSIASGSNSKKYRVKISRCGQYRISRRVTDAMGHSFGYVPCVRGTEREWKKLSGPRNSAAEAIALCEGHASERDRPNRGSLLLAISEGEEVEIGESITIKVIGRKGRRTVIAFLAPKEVPIVRASAKNRNKKTRG